MREFRRYRDRAGFVADLVRPAGLVTVQYKLGVGDW